MNNWIFHRRSRNRWHRRRRSTAMVGSPSLSGNALEFYTTYTYYGGELYYASFGDDTTTSNFVYDAWAYLDRFLRFSRQSWRWI
jgi:putative flippase GtrA